MADVLLDGAVSGLATVSGGIDPLWKLLVGATGGTSLASGDYARGMIFSGLFRGQGSLGLRATDLSGTVTGHAAVTGTVGRVRLLSGRTYGSSRLAFIVPKPIWGQGTLTGFFEVFRVQPPLSCTPAIRELRLGQLLQQGDLGV